MLLEAIAHRMIPAEVGETGLVLSISENARIVSVEHDGSYTEVTVGSDGGVVDVTLEVPIGEAVGYWHPSVEDRRTLLPDWSGEETTSIIKSAPVGCLYDGEGRSQLAFAFAHLVREARMNFGVSEETKRFIIHFHAAPDGESSLVVLRFAASGGRTVYQELRELGAWLSAEHVPAAPDFATEPVYSTWYAFSQRISHDAVVRQAELASQLGLRSVFIDDGWQRFGDGRWYEGCGDWMPDTAKFPALGDTIDRLAALDMRVVLWIAPLLIGERSEAFSRLQQYASSYSEKLRAWILDPRHLEVRQHIVAVCTRLMDDYGVDGLKIDFLDEASIYQGAQSRGDIDDVGEAMQSLFRSLRALLPERDGSEPLIEFRQPYVSPATTIVGNVLRAMDCPADAVANRTQTIDLQLLGTGQIVHSDMTMWDPTASAAAAARQMLGAFFAVPQVSMLLDELPEEHLATVRAYLAVWRRFRATILGGELSGGLPSERFPTVVRAGVDETVIGVFQPVAVDAAAAAGSERVLLVNGTSTMSLWVDFAEPWTGLVRTLGVDGLWSEPEAVVYDAGVQLVRVPALGFAMMEREGARPGLSG